MSGTIEIKELTSRAKKSGNIATGDRVTLRMRLAVKNRRDEGQRPHRRSRISFVNKEDSSKLSIIKAEVSNCIFRIIKKCSLNLSEEKLRLLEENFTVAITEATLPEKAPDLFNPRIDGRGGIVRFLQRTWYDPWIASGVFTRSYFRRLDQRGEMALQNFLRNPENELPFDVPTKSQEWDRKLEKKDSVEQSRRAWRVVAAATRRRAKSGQNSI